MSDRKLMKEAEKQKQMLEDMEKEFDFEAVVEPKKTRVKCR